MGAKKTASFMPYTPGYVPKADEIIPKPYTPGTNRPIIIVDEVYKLGLLKCTQREIAAFFGVSTQAVEERFRKDKRCREAYLTGYERGSISLRRAQMQRAIEDGSDTMLIWLGKQHLGQTDVERQEVQHTGPGGGPVLVATYDLNALSVAELQQLYELRRKIDPPAIEAAAEDTA